MTQAARLPHAPDSHAPRPRPAQLLLSAGTLRAVTASALLFTGAAATAQTPPPVGGGSKMDPRISEQFRQQAEAVLAAAQAGQPGGAPAPSQPAKPAAAPEGDGKAQVKVSEHNTVDLHVKDESITNVLELLSIQSQKNIIASKNVSGKVSADLFGVTFNEALDAILHVNGFQYVEKGNFIYVYTREEFVEIQKALSKRVAKVIHLNYLNAVDAESFVKPLLSQGGDIKTAAKTPEFIVNADAPSGKDDYALGAVLVVIDYEENIAAIEKILAEIDTRPAQVLVEATILETQVIENNGFGVDFSIIGDLDFFDFLNVGGPRGAAQALIRGGNGTSGGFSPADNAGGAVSTSAGNTQDGRSTIKIGVVAGPIGVFMRALDDVSDFTTISNPKILALNRMPSRVLVGQRVGYLNTTATETSTTQTVQFLDTGTTLYFRPFVSSSGEIRMELKPKVASATIRDAGNGQGGIVSIPDETTQEVTTNVIVKDGNTIVLGGLFVERTTALRRQVPILGDIPLIGAAFRGHDDSTDRRELIFLIRPQIVGETAMAMQGIDVKNEIERIRAGQRQGLLPFSREKMTATLNVEAETAAREGKTEEALWKIQRSLSLNSRQPDALRLREKITSEQERWPSNMLLDGVINGEINRRIESVPAAPGSPHHRPHGSVNIPRTPTGPAGAPRSDGSIFDRTLQNALANAGGPANEGNSFNNPAGSDDVGANSDPSNPTNPANPATPSDTFNQDQEAIQSASNPQTTPAFNADPSTNPGGNDSFANPPAGNQWSQTTPAGDQTQPSPSSNAVGGTWTANSSAVSSGDSPSSAFDPSAHPHDMATNQDPAFSPNSAQPHDAAPTDANNPNFSNNPTNANSTNTTNSTNTEPNASNPTNISTNTSSAQPQGASPDASNGPAKSLVRFQLPKTSAAHRRATRLSARAFFEALFFDSSDPSMTSAPADAPQQQQETSK